MNNHVAPRPAENQPRTQVVVIAHAPLASALASVIKRKDPGLEQHLLAYDLGDDSDCRETAFVSLTESLKKYPEGELLIITDVAG